MYESDAYDEGWDAYWEGRCCNPHEEGSQEYEDWQRGLSDACAQDEE